MCQTPRASMSARRIAATSDQIRCPDRSAARTRALNVVGSAVARHNAWTAARVRLPQQGVRPPLPEATPITANDSLGGLNDLLGLSDRLPRFAKAYADLRREIGDAARAFASDVEVGSFPDEAHSYRS